jgi:hypothetical protein
MRSLKQTRTTRRRRSHQFEPIEKFFLTSILIIVAVALGVTNSVAQVTPTATNTTLIAGLTLPFGAQILTGNALSSVTGQPVRHPSHCFCLQWPWPPATFPHSAQCASTQCSCSVVNENLVPRQNQKRIQREAFLASFESAREIRRIRMQSIRWIWVAAWLRK